MRTILAERGAQFADIDRLVAQALLPVQFYLVVSVESTAKSGCATGLFLPREGLTGMISSNVGT